MPTTYTDQFYEMDPYAPPPIGTFLPVFSFNLIDQDDDGDIEANGGDSVDGQDVTQSYPGDTVTVNLSGGGSITYTGTTFYLADGRQVFTPTDGQVLQAGTFAGASAVTTQGTLDVPDLGPPCFVSGTLIDTPNGRVAVESLQVGDRVATVDHGPQVIRWIGARQIAGNGAFAPIRFAAGAMGNDRAMYLSPQHRVLLQGWRAEMLFGEEQVLVGAKHLINDASIRPAPRRDVTYHHILFDQHELVWSDGCITESFFPGDCILSGDPEMRAEIGELFPELLQDSAGSRSETARLVLKGYEARAVSDLTQSRCL